MLVVFIGCQKERTDMASAWTVSREVAKSSDSLSTSFSLYRWNGSLLALGGDAGTYAARILEDDGKSWKTISTTDPGWIPMDADPTGNRFVISRATLFSNRLDATFSIGLITSDGRLSSESKAGLAVNKAQLFPNSQPNLEMTLDERPAKAMFAGGVIVEGREIRIPYSISATPVIRNGRQIGYGAETVSANGVFASSDGGSSWRTELIVNSYSESPIVCKTESFYYYFAKGGRGEPFQLWSSRCSVNEATWSQAETLNKTVAGKLSEGIHAIAKEDIVHVCWLDSRNEKQALSLSRPRAENYEVAYCRRKDADATWSKDTILSRGLRWAYAPSMSVEGNNIIIAWAGARSDKEGRTESNASDIYYVFSKDSGNSWTKPIQVTDGFKTGITSGRPQVAVRNGTIHLFYVQGKITYKKVSAGMVKLNQPPWPILYQQRPFPN
jgi:hypothetical protein